jgi:hypothetical protein
MRNTITTSERLENWITAWEGAQSLIRARQIELVKAGNFGPAMDREATRMFRAERRQELAQRRYDAARQNAAYAAWIAKGSPVVRVGRFALKVVAPC